MKKYYFFMSVLAALFACYCLMLFCLPKLIPFSCGCTLLPMFLTLVFVAIAKGMAEHPMEKTPRCRILGVGLVAALGLFLIIFEINALSGKEFTQLTLVSPLLFSIIFLLFTGFLLLGYLEIKSKRHLMTPKELCLASAFIRAGMLANLLGLIANIAMFF